MTIADQPAHFDTASLDDGSAMSLTPWQTMKLRARYHISFWIGATILSFILIVLIFAPWIAPHDPIQQDLTNRLVNPVWDPSGTWLHPLGTDQFGRDVLSRLIFGTRTSLSIGFTAAIIGATFGSTIGLIGGYFGGRVDAFVMYLLNVKLSLPGLLVTLALVSAFGNSFLVLVLVLAFLFWENYAVALRAAVMQLRNRDFVIAAEAMGACTARIIAFELLPNVINQVIVIFTLEVALTILTEATLSFLGLGVQPPTPSLGLLTAEGRSFMLFKPHLVAIPGLTIFVIAVAINMLGDGIRDITSPASRH